MQLMIMHKGRKFACFIPAILLLFIISVGINACQKETIDFNTPFVDNGTTNVILVDTSTLEMSTVYLDSFPAAGSGVVFAGNYRDPQFGKVNAESYMQVGLPSSITTTPFPVGSVFDSIEVILRYNKTYYGDTTQPYTVSVNQLTQPLALVTGQSTFYNIDNRTYDPTPLGTTQLTLNTGLTDTVRVRLSQAFGQDLFDKLNTYAIEIQNLPQFLNYFPGMAFTGSSNNNLVLGFNDSAVLRLHYLKPGVIPTDAWYDFNITNGNLSFNHVTVDRTGTPLATLGPGNPQIFSSQTGNAAYTQYITGSMMKIRFPNILNIQNLPGYIKVISAQLQIKPISGSYLPFYSLPPQLMLSVTDQYNLPGTAITLINPSTGTPVTQYGNLFIDNYYGIGTAYTYDITAYLQSQLATTENNLNGLLVIPASPTLTFDRVIAGDSKNTLNQTILKVYYVSAP